MTGFAARLTAPVLALALLLPTVSFADVASLESALDHL